MTVLSSGPRRAHVLAVGCWSLLIRPRYLAVCALLAAATVAAVVLTLSAGANSMPLSGVGAALTGHGTPVEKLIVVQLRLPRATNGVVVGFALGIAGALFQSTSRNPLGSPDVIGLNTGAATGALIALLFAGGGVVPTATGALLGGAVTAALVLLLSRRGGIAPLRLVLVGIGTGAILSSVNSLLIVNANLYDAQSASVWLVGNLAGSDWSQLAVLAPVVAAASLGAFALSRGLALGELSDERSAGLGLRPDRQRVIAMALGVVLAGSAIAAAGPIAFVSLAAPQLGRRLTRVGGPNLLAAGLTGAALLALTDFAAREAFPGRQLPTGVLTGIVGGAYLVWLLAREWRKGRA